MPPVGQYPYLLLLQERLLYGVGLTLLVMINKLGYLLVRLDILMINWDINGFNIFTERLFAG